MKLTESQQIKVAWFMLVVTAAPFISSTCKRAFWAMPFWVGVASYLTVMMAGMGAMGAITRHDLCSFIKMLKKVQKEYLAGLTLLFLAEDLGRLTGKHVGLSMSSWIVATCIVSCAVGLACLQAGCWLSNRYRRRQ